MNKSTPLEGVCLPNLDRRWICWKGFQELLLHRFWWCFRQVVTILINPVVKAAYALWSLLNIYQRPRENDVISIREKKSPELLSLSRVPFAVQVCWLQLLQKWWFYFIKIIILSDVTLHLNLPSPLKTIYLPLLGHQLHENLILVFVLIFTKGRKFGGIKITIIFIRKMSLKLQQRFLLFSSLPIETHNYSTA